MSPLFMYLRISLLRNASMKHPHFSVFSHFTLVKCSNGPLKRRGIYTLTASLLTWEKEVHYEMIKDDQENLTEI